MYQLRKFHGVVLFLVFCLHSLEYSCRADWPQGRGPHGDGVSAEKDVTDTLSMEDRYVIWQAPQGGRSTPIVLGGRVFLNAATPHDPTDPREKIHAREQIVCWSAASGELLWKNEFNVFQTDISTERIGWASMAGDPHTGDVFAHSVSGLLQCVTRDGHSRWERSLHEEFGKIAGYGGRTQPPVVDENRLIVGFPALNWGDAGRPPARLSYYAFDKQTGQLLWSSQVGGRIFDTVFSAPIIRDIDGVRMLIGGGGDGGCHALDVRTGRPLWNFRMSKRGVNISPVVNGRRVYISHGEDNIDNLKFGRVQCIDAAGHGDITDTNSVWRVDGIRAGKASPVLHDGVLYVMADTGVLHALDADTGGRLWEKKLGVSASGSLVWADGKLIATTPGGGVFLLRVNRTRGETLSELTLPATKSGGSDEIYAAPAIDNGRLILATRDRVLCLGDQRQLDSAPRRKSPVVAKPAIKGEGSPSLLQLTPYEMTAVAGESITYQLHTYDQRGRLLDTLSPKLNLGTGLTGLAVEGGKLTAPPIPREQAGAVVAHHFGLTARARLRVFPSLPWKWDFDNLIDDQVPPTWIRAVGKLRPSQVDGSTVLTSQPGRGRPSTYFWLGPSSMNGYTIQADVMAREQRRQMSNIGITAQRYDLILQGNRQRASIQSWAPHLRMAREVRFDWRPGVWHTMKLRVLVAEQQAAIQGKIWKRGENEPRAWTLEATDPHPNTKGSPGLYVYSLAECFFDNVSVTKGEAR